MSPFKTWSGKPINPILLILGVGFGLALMQKQIEEDIDKGLSEGLKNAFGNKKS